MNSSISSDVFTILIVDDNPANLELLGDYLEEAGYEIVVAQDGVSALEITRKIQPGVILLDVMMPDMDGFTVCSKIKSDAETKDIPVIFLTSLHEQETKIKGFEAGGIDYITKPIQLGEVLARVRTHLSLRATQKQLTEQNTNLQHEVELRKKIETKLCEAKDNLEMRVKERTIDLATANDKLQSLNKDLALLNRIIGLSISEKSAEEILSITCKELVQALQIPRATAALFNKEHTEIKIVAEYSLKTTPPALGWKLSDTICTRIANNINGDALCWGREDDDRNAICAQWEEVRNTAVSLLLPLYFKGTPLGVLTIEGFRDNPLEKQEVEMMQSVANQVAIIIAQLQIEEEQKQLQKQYHQAQKMEAVGRLTGGVAHDFNNILSVIFGASDLLIMRTQPSSPLIEDIVQIKSAAERAAGLTQQLLAFSRQQLLQPMLLDLNEVVTNLEKMLRRMISEEIDLKIIQEEQLQLIKADRGQIEQVLMNLAVNASDAMPEGGTLIFETSNTLLDEEYAAKHYNLAPGPYIMLTVKDSGIGIDLDTQEKIFEPFFTSKKKGDGTGLGLATVHGIITQSCGHVKVDSQPGEGTTFTIYIPCFKRRKKSNLLLEEKTIIKKGCESVLIVEDDEILRDIVYRTLKEFNYNVFKAGNGVEALEVSRKHAGPIHLLLTDVILPGDMNGPQIADRLIKRLPKLKVLYMSGYTDDAIASSGVLEDGLHFLPKPFTQETLLLKVRDVLDNPKQNLL